MVLEGRVWREGYHWLAEIPGLDYLTQGSSKTEALNMVKDIIRTGSDFPKMKLKLVATSSSDMFKVKTEESWQIIPLLLRRLRQKNGLTIREVSRRMGSSSPTAYSRYELGKATPSLEKLEELLQALNSRHELILKIA